MSTLDELTVPKIEQTGPVAADEFVYVDISSVDNKTKRIVGPKRLPVTEAPSRARQRLRAGDVLVSMTRPNLNAVAIVPPELDGSIGSTGFHDLRAKDAVDPRWLFNAVQSRDFIETMEDFVQGALYPAVRPKDICGYELHVPPLEEQRRVLDDIEKQFSRLDEAVANLQRVKANLKRYKASVLKDAVEGRLVPTEAELARREGRSFETGEQLLQRILETRRSAWKGKGKCKEPVAPDTDLLPELPQGWSWATYAQTGDVTTGFTPPTGDPANFGGNIPFFKPSDLDVGENVVKAREYLSDKAVAKGRSLKAGSVLVTCIGATIGKAGLAGVDCATNQQINAVTLWREGASPVFVYHWTVSLAGQAQILDNSSATTLPILNKSKFEAHSVPLPPLNEQHRIVAEVDRRLTLVREVEAEVDANLKRAQALRQAVLATNFRHKCDVERRKNYAGKTPEVTT